MKNIVGLMTVWWAINVENPKKSVSEGHKADVMQSCQVVRF